MISLPIYPNSQSDRDAWASRYLSLSPEQMQCAIDRCQSIADADQQWQVYLTALARLGVEQWLQDQAPDLSIREEIVREETALAEMQIGSFRLHLVVMGTLTDTVVTIPTAAIDQAEHVAHFYVLAEVLEEQEQVGIHGYLRYDQLMQQLQDTTLSHDSAQTYLLPLNWFELQPDHLLLYLRCLDPDAISLPAIAPASLTPATHMANLTDRTLTDRAVNVGLWLRNRLDEVAQELAWVLLPPLRPAAGMLSMRSPTEQLDAIVGELVEQGLEVPLAARSAYKDLMWWEEVTLRLYVVAWEVQEPNEFPEWSLLLVLGATPGDRTPPGLRLIVHDQSQILVDRTLSEQSGESYLFTQVIGDQREGFWVSIDIGDGVSVTLPPFYFNQDIA